MIDNDQQQQQQQQLKIKTTHRTESTNVAITDTDDAPKQLQQLMLDVCLSPDHATFDNFYTGNNQNIVLLLQSMLNNDLNPSIKFIYLWGEHACGRTHLLTACCSHCRNQHDRDINPNSTAIYIPFKDLKGSSPKILENLENMSLLCFDDFDAIAGFTHWEEEFLHCFNRLQQPQKSCYIVVTANATPSALPLKLEDLRSRMNSGIIHEVKALDDEQKIAALQSRAKQLGLTLSNRAASFLINHYSRDTTSLFTLLHELDQKSLQAYCRITIPFIKQVLKI